MSASRGAPVILSEAKDLPRGGSFAALRMTGALGTAASRRILAAVCVLALGLGGAACSKDGFGGLGRGKGGKGKAEKTSGERMLKTVTDKNDAAAEFAVARTALNRPKIGDRFYVSSVFLQVFGPSVEPMVNGLVRNNVVAFGGPCDQLGRLGSNHCNGRLSLSQATIMPSSMATREGLRARACEAAVQNDEAVKFAVAQIPDATPERTPLAKDAAGAYQLFFVGLEPTPEEIEGLQGVAVAAGEGGSEMDQWRYMLLSVCLAPGWQML